MPRPIYIVTGILIILAIIPILMIAKARAVKSDVTRIHPILDMDNQPKYKSQSYNPMFADRRAMRPSIPGTVARGDLQLDTHFYEGKINGEWADSLPMPINQELLKRGQERFEIYCAVCHGLDGYGNGMINKRAQELQEGTWVQPTNYHTDQVRQRPDGHIFNTITNGIRNMPSYSQQIPVADRWAIVAYLRALQRSQNASPEDVPEEYRDDMR